MGRTDPGYYNPNSENYGNQPQTDPGHLHTAASVSGKGSTGAAASSPAFTSTVAKQLSTTQDVHLLIAINTSASLAITMGPTTGAENTILAAEVAALGVITLPVPVGWRVVITGTIADLTITELTL